MSKFNQIDPEEHAQALASIEKLKKECAAMKRLKEQADANTGKSKTLVSRLNKEVSTLKASVEAFKAALEKSKSEKEQLTKSAKSGQMASKKVTEAQAATKKVEATLKEKTAEVGALTSRLNNFKEMMNRMKAALRVSNCDLRFRAFMCFPSSHCHSYLGC